MNNRVDRFMHSVTWWTVRQYQTNSLIALIKGLLYVALVLAMNLVAYLVLFVYVPKAVIWLLGG